MIICPACNKKNEEHLSRCTRCFQRLHLSPPTNTYESQEIKTTSKITTYCETSELVELANLTRNMIKEDKDYGYGTLEKYKNNNFIRVPSKKAVNDTIVFELRVPDFCKGKNASGNSVDDVRMTLKEILPYSLYDKHILNILSFVLQKRYCYMTYNRIGIIETILFIFQLYFYYLEKNITDMENSQKKKSISVLGKAIEYLFCMDFSMFEWLVILRNNNNYHSSNYVSQILNDYIKNFKNEYINKNLSFNQMSSSELYDYELKIFNEDLLEFLNEFSLYYSTLNPDYCTTTFSIDNNSIKLLSNNASIKKSESLFKKDQESLKRIKHNPTQNQCKYCYHINPVFYEVCEKCKEPLIVKDNLKYSECLSRLESQIQIKDDSISYCQSQIDSLKKESEKSKKDYNTLKTNYYKYYNSALKYKKRQLFIALFSLLFLISLIVNIFVIYSNINISKQQEDANFTYLIDNYSQKVAAGEQAFVSIYGKPNTYYSISVVYSSGVGTADGLEGKTSDEKGYVEWSWKVGNHTNPGKYPITISDSKNKVTLYFNVT